MLFKTDAELKAYLTFVNTSFKLDHITDRIKARERDLIKDVLGDTEYTKLETKYQADDMDTKQTALLPYVQEVLAFLAFLDHIPYLNVDVGPGGLRVNVNTSKVAASQFRTEDLKAQVARDGYNALEVLLKFLWSNPDDYLDWKVSNNKAKYRSFFINTASEFSEYVDINNSYYLFTRIKANIRNVEQSYIKGVICCDLFDAIKAEVLAGSVSEENEKLMQYIRPAVANMAYIQAVASKTITLTDDGSVVERFKEGRDNINFSSPARNESISQNLKVCKDIANENLQNLKDYLYAHYDTYDLFEASDCYDAEEETGNVSISEQNEEDDKVVIV